MDNNDESDVTDTVDIVSAFSRGMRETQDILRACSHADAIDEEENVEKNDKDDDVDQLLIDAIGFRQFSLFLCQWEL